MAIKLGDLELATPGDVIVGGTTYGVVFAIDAFYFSGGATSAQSAGAAAVAALGVKYGIQGLLSRRRARQDAQLEERKSEEQTSQGPDGPQQMDE